MTGSPLGDWLNAPSEPQQGLADGDEVEFVRPVEYDGEQYTKGIIKYRDIAQMHYVVTVRPRTIIPHAPQPFTVSTGGGPQEIGTFTYTEDLPELVVRFSYEDVYYGRAFKLPKPKTNAEAFIEMMADGLGNRTPPEES